MKTIQTRSRRSLAARNGQLSFTSAAHKRRGSVLVLAAALLIVIFGMTAFSVDMSYMALTKTQLQSAADSSALAACQELTNGLGGQPISSIVETEAIASNVAVAMASLQRNGDLNSTALNPSTDIMFGLASLDTTTGHWSTVWGATPYNAVRVSPQRSANGGGIADRRLGLLFAPILGIDKAELTAEATAALLPGVGFGVDSGSSATVEILPIALDVPTWNALMAGVGSDEYTYNSTTGAVSTGADGIKEVDLYPYGNGSLPPGNRGTVDLGSPNNSTNDLKRQILYGLNAYDLSFFGGEIRTDEGNLILNGDTGISAGIKDALEQIKGRPRLIPLFSAVAGPGNNAMYTVPKFVGIRIMHVKLTGGTKKVVVQPAPFVSSQVIRGNTTVSADTYFTKPRLIN